MTEKTVACLSVRQPWASLIVHGIKPIENRTWRCAYRGRLVIHASKTWGREENEDFRRLLQNAIYHKDARRQEILCLSRSLMGGFVGTVNMRDCIGEREWYRTGGAAFDGWNEWFVGSYGWVFTGAKTTRLPWPSRFSPRIANSDTGVRGSWRCWRKYNDRGKRKNHRARP